jgi:hypothetical protein
MAQLESTAGSDAFGCALGNNAFVAGRVAVSQLTKPSAERVEGPSGAPQRVTRVVKVAATFASAVRDDKRLRRPFA